MIKNLAYLTLGFLYANQLVNSKELRSLANGLDSRVSLYKETRSLVEETCQLEQGVNYLGNDIGKSASPTPNNCCDLCKKTPGCNAVTWNKFNGGVCWFKSKKDKVVNDPTCVSLTTKVVVPTCKVEQGVEYLDNDVGSASCLKPCDCFDKCKAFKNCNVFTWTEYNGGTCWFKSKKDKTKPDPSCISAVVNEVVPQPTCKLQKGLNIIGCDIGSKDCVSSDQCCDLCEKFPGCKAWTWSKHNGGTCWFKDKQGPTIPDPSCDSSAGVVVVPDQNCGLEKDVDFVDNDVGNVPAAKACDCVDKCKAFKGCKAFSWSNYNGGTCWLKSKKYKTKPSPGVQSLLVDASVDPIPDQGNCGLEKNVDYVDNDIGNVPAMNACDCVDKCKAFKGCKAFSWSSYSGGTCWLKSKKDKTVPKDGVYSSTVVNTNPGCGLENGVDYVDNDVGNVPSLDACGCVDKCKAFKGCKAFTWTNYNGGTCWLKSKKDKWVSNVYAMSLVVDSTQQTCNLEKDVDYVDNDIGNVGCSKAEDCCDKCQAFKGCKAFSWSNYNGGTCWFKSKKDKFISKPGVVSSTL